MTPKEKAKDLVDKYDFDHNEFDFSKEYALIAVDELMHHIRFHLAYGYEKQLIYFQEVKQEIINL